jgi:hypothetical protein
MTLKEKVSRFVRRYDGKRIDGYSRSGGQCVDAVRQFMAETFGWSRSKIYNAVPPGNAKTFFANANPKYFRKVKNTPDYVPPVGAIGVYGSSMGNGYGHVVIVREDSTKRLLKSFDQNYSLYRKCAREAHRYSGCIGFLIKR